LTRAPRPRARLVVPEVVQTSAMDCGPAALKCLLEGFGIPVSYGRLREACQTDVDGTSIDTIEDVAVQLGLEAEQVMVPVDHLLVPAARLLPAIVVVRLPGGDTHFVVAWRRHGPVLQVMDPATGRRWPTCRSFLGETYVHDYPVAAATWREWAGSEDFLSPLRERLGALGAGTTETERLVAEACADPGWRSLAALDAAVRAVAAIAGARGIRRGDEAVGILGRLVAGARDESPAAAPPAGYWSVRPTDPGEGGEERVVLRGAVLVRVRGARVRSAAEAPAPLSPDLAAALEEPPARPGRDLLRLLAADGAGAPAALAGALFLAAGGVIVEAVLFRGLFDIGRELGLAGQRLTAMGALLAFVAALLLLDLPTAAGLLRLGRRLELRLRAAILAKVPRLGDRYFQSRLTSDMAERMHGTHRVRLLPDLGGQLARAVFELVLTAAGIVWLDPALAPIALLAAVAAVVPPLLVQPLLVERDLRVRTHAGALGRFYSTRRSAGSSASGGGRSSRGRGRSGGTRRSSASRTTWARRSPSRACSCSRGAGSSRTGTPRRSPPGRTRATGRCWKRRRPCGRDSGPAPSGGGSDSKAAASSRRRDRAGGGHLAGGAARRRARGRRAAKRPRAARRRGHAAARRSVL
jgi:ATP-binding cassette subfamily B protein